MKYGSAVFGFMGVASVLVFPVPINPKDSPLGVKCSGAGEFHQPPFFDRIFVDDAQWVIYLVVLGDRIVSNSGITPCSCPRRLREKHRNSSL